MMTILHGDDVEKSRQEFIRLLNARSSDDVRRIDGKTIDKTQLLQALESSSLFGEKLLVVIESFLTHAGKKSKQKDDIVSLLISHCKETDLLLYETKSLSKSVTGALSAYGSLREFTFPKYMFQLLDDLQPSRPNILLHHFHNCIKTEAPELTLAPLVRRIRHLIMIKDRVTPEGMLDWQLGRLTMQANLFTMEKLVAMEQNLLTIEYSIKNGTSPYALTEHLELFFSAL